MYSTHSRLKSNSALYIVSHAHNRVHFSRDLHCPRLLRAARVGHSRDATRIRQRRKSVQIRRASQTVPESSRKSTPPSQKISSKPNMKPCRVISLAIQAWA